MADELARAKASLQIANGEGYSVYDHVFDIVTKALEDKKGFAPDALPEYSRTVKGHRFQHASGGEKEGWQPAAIDPRDISRAGETKTLFERAAPVVETKIDRPRPNVTVTTTEVRPVTSKEPRPLALDVRYHRMCGVGLPRHEIFLLDQSITRLVQEKKLQEVRFFGKIFGTHANYIVVSSKRWTEEGEQFWKEKYQTPAAPRKKLEVPVQPEPPGAGLNRVTFWVCPYAGAQWTALPDVTPQQINSARRMKKYLTGDLDQPVNSYPPFHGTEKNLLRAQLARITASTLVCPEGERSKVEAEEEEDAEEEEGAAKGPKPLKWLPLHTPPSAVPQEEGIGAFKDPAKWQHCSQYIFKDGRANKLPDKPEAEEGDEPPPEEEEEEEQNEADKEEAQQAFRDDFLGGGVGVLTGDSKYGLLKIPPEPKQEEEGEEGEGEGEGEKAEDEEDDDEPPKEEEAGGEEGEEEDPTKKWKAAWVPKGANELYRKHGVALMRSVRWPGAFAWLGGGERQISGCVYFGDGMKTTDAAFRPNDAPRIQGEPVDIVETNDPTVMDEKLVLRGEDPKPAEEDDEPDEEPAEEGE